MAISHDGFTGASGKLRDDFKAKFNDYYYTYQTYTEVAMLAAAMAKAKSTDAVKVAAAMEGLTFQAASGEATMRKTDHQLQQYVFISKWTKADKKNPYSTEDTGYNFALVKTLEPYIASTPTSCQMKRPG